MKKIISKIFPDTPPTYKPHNNTELYSLSEVRKMIGKRFTVKHFQEIGVEDKIIRFHKKNGKLLTESNSTKESWKRAEKYTDIDTLHKLMLLVSHDRKSQNYKIISSMYDDYVACSNKIEVQPPETASYTDRINSLIQKKEEFEKEMGEFIDEFPEYGNVIKELVALGQNETKVEINKDDVIGENTVVKIGVSDVRNNVENGEIYPEIENKHVKNRISDKALVEIDLDKEIFDRVTLPLDIQEIKPSEVEVQQMVWEAIKPLEVEIDSDEEFENTGFGSSKKPIKKSIQPKTEIDEPNDFDNIIDDLLNDDVEIENTGFGSSKKPIKKSIQPKTEIDEPNDFDNIIDDLLNDDVEIENTPKTRTTESYEEWFVNSILEDHEKYQKENGITEKDSETKEDEEEPIITHRDGEEVFDLKHFQDLESEEKRLEEEAEKKRVEEEEREKREIELLEKEISNMVSNFTPEQKVTHEKMKEITGKLEIFYDDVKTTYQNEKLKAEVRSDIRQNMKTRDTIQYNLMVIKTSEFLNSKKELFGRGFEKFLTIDEKRFIEETGFQFADMTWSETRNRYLAKDEIRPDYFEDNETGIKYQVILPSVSDGYEGGKQNVLGSRLEELYLDKNMKFSTRKDRALWRAKKQKEYKNGTKDQQKRLIEIEQIESKLQSLIAQTF
jgi:hypothetical protein